MKLVKPKKFLGQHFLKDLKVAQDIADTVDTFPELPVLEVGPGMGVLTQFLVKKDRLVKVVEVDYESVAYLREAYPSLEDHIIEDDFLKMNLHRLFDGKPFVLTGNYPYNISSQIFFKMLEKYLTGGSLVLFRPIEYGNACQRLSGTAGLWFTTLYRSCRLQTGITFVYSQKRLEHDS